MNDAEPTDMMGSFTFFPVVVPLEAGPRRLIISNYALHPAGGGCFWLDERASQGALLRRLELSFEFTRGAPPTLIMRTLRPLGRAAAWGEPVWTPQFLRFCTHYGCRPVFEARDRRWEGGLQDAILRQTYRDLSELEYVLGLWNSAPPPPASGLRSLPERPFLTLDEVFRRATADGFVLHDGNYYSVPQTHAGKSLWIRRHADTITVATASGDAIAAHRISSGRGEAVMDPAHFRPRTHHSLEARRIEQAFLQRFPGQQTFLSLLAAQQRSGAAEHLKAILRIANEFADESWRQAFQQATRCNNFSHKFLSGWLRAAHGVKPVAAAQSDAVQGDLF